LLCGYGTLPSQVNSLRDACQTSSMRCPSDRQLRCNRILAVARDNFTPVASTKLRPIRTFFNEPERTVQTAFGSKSQPPLDNHTKTHWIVRYCDSEQKVAIAKAGLETVPDLPANTQFLEAGGAVSVDENVISVYSC